MKIDHFSASQLGMLARCGEQFRRRYVLGEIRPPAFVMHAGTAVHRTIAANLRTKALQGQQLPVEQLQDMARDYMAQIVEEAVETDRDESRPFDQVKGEYTDQAVSGAATHRLTHAATINPVMIGEAPAVERHVEVAYEGWPWSKFVAYFDIEEARGIRDTKLTGRAPQAGKADDSLQLTAYAVLYKELYGRLPDGLYLDNIVIPKKTVVVQETKRTAKDEESFWRRMECAANMIEKEVFAPCPPDHWTCSEKFCGYFKTCPYRS